MLLKSFFKQIGFWAIVIMAIIYQLSMVGFYLWGFSGLDHNSNQLRIEIVNQDSKQIGKQVSKGLANSLDYKVSQTKDLRASKEKLKLRKTNLIILIPKKFTDNVINGKKVKLSYYQNQANPVTITGTIRGMSTVVTQTVASQLETQKTKGVIEKLLEPEVVQKVESQVQQASSAKVKTIMAAQIKKNPMIATSTAIQEQVKNGIEQKVRAQAKKTANTEINKQMVIQTNRVAKIAHVNLTSSMYKVDSGKNKMAWQMTPMFLTMSVYLGAMIGTMTLVGMLNGFRTKFNKWAVFGAVELGGLVLAIVSPIFGVGMASLILHFSWRVGIELYAQMAFLQMVALNFTLIPALIFRSLGLWINIPLMMMGAVVGGGTIPLKMLPNGLQGMHWITPLYPAVQTSYDILFKTGQSSGSEVQLAIIGMISFVICIGIVALQPRPAVLN